MSTIFQAKHVEQRSVDELKLQLSENNKAKQAMEKEMDKLKLEVRNFVIKIRCTIHHQFIF